MTLFSASAADLNNTAADNNSLNQNLEINEYNTNLNYSNTNEINENDEDISIKELVNNSKSGDTIVLNPGEYRESGIIIDHDLTIKGNGSSDEIIINGNGGNNGSEPIFKVIKNGDSITVNFINLTFINGNNTHNDGTGGVIDNYANVKIYNCNFINNSAYTGGCIASEKGTLYVNNSNFINNHAEHDGGALKSIQGSRNIIENSNFINNSAIRDGGAIGFTTLSNTTIDNCIFKNNSGAWGGAIYNWAASMTINNSIISNNQANRKNDGGGLGGAIMTSGQLTLLNSEITNNYALKIGGGIVVQFEDKESFVLKIEYNNIWNNTAPKFSDFNVVYDDRLKLGESSLNNNWWGENNPLNKTKWLNRYNDSSNTIKLPETWININTNIDTESKTIDIESYIYNSTDNSLTPTAITDGKEVYFNQENISKKLNDGKTSLKYNNEILLNETITTVDNEKYPIIKANTKLNIDLINESFIITLTDDNMNIIPNGTIYYYINNAKINETLKTNNSGQIKIKLNNGKYNLTALYLGDDDYSSTNITVLINNLEKIKTNIIYADMIQSAVDFYNGERGGFFEVTLKDVNGNVLSNKPVSIGFNGVVYNRTTNSTGGARLQINLQYPGVYTFAISFLSDDKYYGSFAVSKITINKHNIPSKIISSNLVKVYNTNTKYTATLLNSLNQPLKKQKIVFTLNSKKYTVITDNNGQASINIKNLKPKEYNIKIAYNGNSIYKSSSINRKITVKAKNKKVTGLIADDLFKNYNNKKSFGVQLVNSNGNGIKNQKIILTINNVKYTKITNSKGQVSIPVNLKSGIYTISIKYSGSKNYNSANIQKYIIIKDNIYITPAMNNSQIQDILDNSNPKETIIFNKGNYYNVNLNINKPLNVTGNNATLNGIYNKTIITIVGSDSAVNGFSINTNNSTAIELIGQNNKITNNNIKTVIPENKTRYYDGTEQFNNYGINVNSNNNLIINNKIINHYTGINIKNANNNTIENNTINENNYGVYFDEEVSNTKIQYNNISKNIGYIDYENPEGPIGYGIFVNKSANNLTVYNNQILDNYIGINFNSPNSTGIDVESNIIYNSTLEGIVFWPNYTPINNEYPTVINNAIYNNAKGPGMFILGEMSANPEGIYAAGVNDTSKRLFLGPNFYGINSIVTWNLEGTVGAGTMCPRIQTTAIHFNNLTYLSPGNYSINFYIDENNTVLASKLPDFKIYAYLNGEHETEINVHNGIGNFKFNTSDYLKNQTNEIWISSGSLFDEERIFRVIFYYNITDNEI